MLRPTPSAVGEDARIGDSYCRIVSRVTVPLIVDDDRVRAEGHTRWNNTFDL